MQYVTETKDGYVLLQRDDVCLPAYELGQTVVYTRDNVKREATIEGHYASTSVKDGEIVHEVLYELDNGESVYENEVDEYYPMED
jgi:hypothetical protein